MPAGPKKFALAALAAGGCLVLAVGVTFFSGPSTPSSAPEFPTHRTAVVDAAAGLPLAGVPSATGRAAAPPDGGSPGDGGVDDPLSLDEFMGVLEKRAPKELAQRVAKAFMKEPALRVAWRQYKEKSGGKGSAREFVGSLFGKAEFRQLLAKFQGDPGFQKAFADIMKDSRVIDAVTADPDLEPASDVGTIAQEWEQKARSGVDAHVGVRGAGSARPEGLLASLSGRAATSSSMLASGASGPGAGGGVGMGGAGASGGAGGPPPENKKGVDEHAVDVKIKDYKFKEKEVESGFKFADARKHLMKFLLALTESTRKRVQAQLESGAEDIWGACWTTAAYDECRSVCGQVPEMNCENKDRWEACRSGNTRSAKTCVIACLDGNPLSCDPHPNEWDPLCKNGNSTPELAQNYCSNAQPWGPCIPRAFGGCDQPVGSHGGSAPTLVVGAPAVVAAPAATNTGTGSGTGTGTGTGTRTTTGTGTRTNTVTTTARLPPSRCPPSSGGCMDLRGCRIACNAAQQTPRPTQTNTGPIQGPALVVSNTPAPALPQNNTPQPPSRLDGAINGAIIGATIGMIGGPPGVVVGAVVGAVIGAIIPAKIPCIPIPWVKKCP